MEEKLWQIAVVDNHAHNIIKDSAGVPFVAGFTEGEGEEIQEQVRSTLFFRRSMRDLAELYQCEPTESSIIAKRLVKALQHV
jgi:hypothetical protein